MELSVAMTDFRHSNFTEAIYEINVTLDRERTKMGLLSDCYTLQPMLSLTACARLTNDIVVTHTGRDVNTERRNSLAA